MAYLLKIKPKRRADLDQKLEQLGPRLRELYETLVEMAGDKHVVMVDIEGINRAIAARRKRKAVM